jgi:hypothetical protein
MSADNWVTMFFIMVIVGAGLAIPVALLLPDNIGASIAGIFLVALATAGIVVVWKHR